MQTISKPKLLTTDEAAEFLGVSPGTLAVWRCLARYRLPYHLIGRNVRYLESDLIAWIKARESEIADRRERLAESKGYIPPKRQTLLRRTKGGR
jgi:excisionase family DNA binding protein